MRQKKKRLHCRQAAIGVLVAVGLGVSASATYAADAVLKLERGDRICIIGNTFAERMALFGNFEAMLASRFPELELTVRNLGWSADELTRAHLQVPGNPFHSGEFWHLLQPRPLNFGDMHNHLEHQEADVVIACFGMNESFRGKARLNKFRADTRALIASLREHQYNGQSPPRIVLVSPIPYEQLMPLMPDPAVRNADLAAYTAAMQQVANEERVAFVDLFDTLRPLMGDPSQPAMTINGIHLTRYGDWVAASLMLRELGWLPEVVVDLDGQKLVARAEGVEVRGPTRRGRTIAFQLDQFRPVVPTPGGETVPPALADTLPKVRVRGLPPGKYALQIDREVVATADADGWAEGVPIEKGPAHEAGADLRKTVNDKNEQFFYRWRPVNGEYIYGRRKEPFGVVNFPKEMQQLDEIVAALDGEVHERAQPSQTLDCELNPAEP